uniref:RRM domain-containing protein n=1 Tax=Oryza glumipatula TaxID=40148 RepID=A0A0D9Y4P4_9ORYZ
MAMKMLLDSWILTYWIWMHHLSFDVLAIICKSIAFPSSLDGLVPKLKNIMYCVGECKPFKAPQNISPLFFVDVVLGYMQSKIQTSDSLPAKISKNIKTWQFSYLFTNSYRYMIRKIEWSTYWGYIHDKRTEQTPFLSKSLFTEVELFLRDLTNRVKGEACMICKNDANETLHLRNICFDWTKDDLAEELKTYKLENLEDINLVEDPERKGKNRGYAFLDFRTNVDGVDAFFKLQNRDIYLGTDVRAQVSFSKTLSQDDKIMEKVKSVFLDGLPPHWDEDKVREVFGKFGEIDSIHLARNMFKAKRKDFGFIGFTSRQSALDCISTVSKGGIVEGSGKVRIKASLQRPRPTLKKHSWQGITPMLGIRRGFIGKSYGDREHYGDRERYDDRERYHNRERYGHIHRYERARPREAYLDSRYTNEYPRHRHSRHEESIQRDAYRSKYGHSYLERSHRDSCPDCNPSDHSSSAFYKTGRKLMASSSPGMNKMQPPQAPKWCLFVTSWPNLFMSEVLSLMTTLLLPMKLRSTKNARAGIIHLPEMAPVILTTGITVDKEDRSK